MDPSPACVALIKESEGLVLTPYQDAGGEWTVGWGHKLKLGEAVGLISQNQAEDYLNSDLSHAADTVGDMVAVPLTQGQFDALCDFTFNLGSGRLQGSTLLAKLNAGDYAGAADQFQRWVYANGVELPGLVIRRAKERALFES